MPILAADQITRRFGGVLALDAASFALEPGEIHALLGGNGAGKSTMVKIISGVLPPDDGVITVQGETVSFGSPADATKVGIIPVFQELSLLPNLTVAENLFLNHEPTKFGIVDRGAMRRAAEELLQSLDFPRIDPDVTIRDMPLADRQLIEIAKAISREPAILVLDEATSALGHAEVVRLFHVLRRLSHEGTSIVFISHRMEEVFALCDKATVFRDGVDVGTVDVRDTSADQIVRMMIGRDLTEVFPERPPRPEVETVALQVDGLSWGVEFQDVSFTVNEGEIVGLAGLDGQGQGDLLMALFGVYAGVEGSVSAGDRAVSLRSPLHAMDAGFALIPEDRKTQGLILPLSVRDNLSMSVLPTLATAGVISSSKESALAESMIDGLSIKTSSPDAPVRFLSGGNQQKVSISKWLATEASVYLMYDPTRGIDVSTKQEIYRLMRSLAAEGAAILLFSTDSAEIIGLCDRALVMYEGRIVQELVGEEITKDNLLTASLGLESVVSPA